LGSKEVRLTFFANQSKSFKVIFCSFSMLVTQIVFEKVVLVSWAVVFEGCLCLVILTVRYLSRLASIILAEDAGSGGADGL
jgi:hypothetical protein